jgi:ribonuclease Z
MVGNLAARGLTRQAAPYYGCRNADVRQVAHVIDLLLLGNGSMQPLPNRWLSSLMIRHGSDLVLFDCGEGTQVAARTYGWGFKRIAAICLSHHHADHVAGLPGILMCIANAGRTAPVTIYGPRQTLRIVEGLLVICPPLPFELRVAELADGDVARVSGNLRASVIEVEQRGMPVLVWRFELPRSGHFDREAARQAGVPRERWGELQRGESVEVDGVSIPGWRFLGPDRPGLAFGIVTDTRPSPRIASFLHDLDLLVSEATYLEDAAIEKAKAVDHFTLSEACDLAIASGAKRLLLTHFSATYADPTAYQDRARGRFTAAEIGVSGWTTTLKFP